MFRNRPRFRFHGDKQKSESLYMQAWQFLEAMKSTCPGLPQKGPFRRRFQDGTEYLVREVFGQQFVDVFVPEVGQEEVESRKVIIAYKVKMVRSDGKAITPEFLGGTPATKIIGNIDINGYEINEMPLFYFDNKSISDLNGFVPLYDNNDAQIINIIESQETERIIAFDGEYWNILISESSNKEDGFVFAVSGFNSGTNCLDTAFAPNKGYENKLWYNTSHYNGEEGLPSLDIEDQRISPNTEYTMYIPHIINERTDNNPYRQALPEKHLFDYEIGVSDFIKSLTNVKFDLQVTSVGAAPCSECWYMVNVVAGVKCRCASDLEWYVVWEMDYENYNWEKCLFIDEDGQILHTEEDVYDGSYDYDYGFISARKAWEFKDKIKHIDSINQTAVMHMSLEHFDISQCYYPQPCEGPFYGDYTGEVCDRVVSACTLDQRYFDFSYSFTPLNGSTILTK